MPESFADRLLQWYDSTARDLLWRRSKDPYRVWVSEVMLQQTRVEAVKPYYERWINRYPDAQALAASTEDEVMQHWQGLGYYARARNLLRGVREVCSSYGGQVPDNKTDIRSIAGIGEYTAGAILSISYGQPEPAVDGNVLRVFSRLYCIEEEISRTSVKRKITELVQQTIPADRPGDFNQALMELGATACSPRNPRCGDCPVAEFCCAVGQQRQNELPVKKQKMPVKTIRLAAVAVRKDGKYLLFQRPNTGLLAGMWEFPTVEIESETRIEARVNEYLQKSVGATVTLREKLFELTHLFSHRKWEISFFCGTILLKEEKEPSYKPDKHIRWGWFASSEWPQLCFAGPHRRAADYLLAAEQNRNAN